MHEDFFKYSNDEIKNKVWRERIQPYIDNDPIYKVSNFILQLFKWYNFVEIHYSSNILEVIFIMSCCEISFQQEEDFCTHFDKIYEDPSFSAYVMVGKGELTRCKRFYSCEIVKVPYVIDTAMGGGWVFPKNSPFYPIFDYYVSILKRRRHLPEDS